MQDALKSELTAPDRVLQNINELAQKLYHNVCTLHNNCNNNDNN